MTKIEMTIQLEYDETTMHEEGGESLRWFFEDVLGGADGETLSLWSSLIGDVIGDVTVLGIGAVTKSEAGS